MSFSIRVPSLITPVYCIRQTEEPDFCRNSLKQVGEVVLQKLTLFMFKMLS
ncbi:hypothetical protein C789_3980 [Microcystis aeruginosa FACHB-905 = DIANCHI905]|uniref:Uncharacterized protein n=1 Tax=Microcystis aeruginosa PCC 7806SL TaxID=1903187 RepID=A0AB33BV91_MICA7|nr:hypothetical protein BH695_2909 [Microcystis aeruginosa PCC 7806SL]ELS46224.1 hypothetical protein C789_3980 [Microcystis aeruginosa FACHB-905 = DIANCHI905]